MALADVMNVPGLAGHIAARQMTAQDEAQQLQQATGAMNLAQMLRQRQQDEQLRAALAESGGDVEAALAAALKTGNVQAAHQLAPVVQFAQKKREADDMAKGVQAINAPDAPLPEGADPRQARIAKLKQLSTIYAKNPVVSQRIQAEIDKLENMKPMVEHNFSVGENLVQPHISYDNGQTWKPVPGSKPSAKFAKMVPDQGPPVTDDTLAMDAWRYLTDGTLPPNMGRGAQGAAQATKIRNEASRLAKEMGMSADEIRFAQLNNRTQVQAIGQLAKARAQILQFEKTANMNADLALQGSEKVDRTGVPVLNRWIQAGRVNIAGDPEAAAFHAATETFVSEYARVMSGGYGAAQTTEGAQNRAHTLLNTANTKEQFRRVVGQLKTEMGNRVKALNDQMEEERQILRKGIVRSPTKPGAQSPAPQPPASPNAPSAAVAPPAPYSDPEKERRYQEWKRANVRQ